MKKWKKWLSFWAMVLLLSLGCFRGQAAEAAQKPYDRSDSVAPQELVPEVGASSETEKKVSAKAWKKINGICYNGSGKAISGAITRGIDVSEWQGKINWNQVKKDVDFAFIRISYGTSHLDNTYEYNMTQAELAGVPVGTYVYSLATNTTMALKEAQFAIQQMKGHKVSYPVVFDLEDASAAGLSKRRISQIALTFCDEIRKAGYTPMLYMNLNWYNNHVDWSLLEGAGLDVWLACFGDKILAPDASRYKYTIWQSTAGDEVEGMNTTKGLIRGIPKENNVDVDFGFVDYTTKIVPRWNAQEGYVPATEPLIPDESLKKGWITENGKTYYYVKGEMAMGWKKISGKYYYFHPKNGYLRKNVLVKSGSSLYYVDKNGVRVTNKLVTKNGNTYYFGSDGKAASGITKVSGKYYYFNPTDHIMRKDYKYVSSQGTIYYFGSNGVRFSGGFKKIEENGRRNTYYFGSNGRAYKGWKTIKGKKYYFYKGTGPKAGVRAERVTLTDSKGTVSVFDKYGVCISQYKK